MSLNHQLKAQHPLVSIVLCTFNGEQYIRKQLETIVNQTYDNLEIIVSDDCSSDGTILIIDEFCHKYNYIKLYRNEVNLGLVKNFEKAIQLASGEYIALSDQDDLWELSKINDLVDNIGESVLIYHDSSFIDEEGNPLTNERMSTRNVMYEGRSCLPFIYSNCVSGHAILFKREMLRFLSQFDTRFFHDWWIVYVALNIGSIKYLDKVLVKYRQHGTNVTDPLRLNTPHPGIKDFPVSEEWAHYCSKFPDNSDPALIEEAYEVICNVYRRKNKARSFLFLLKNFELLFHIANPPRNIFDKVRIVKKIVFRRK